MENAKKLYKIAYNIAMDHYYQFALNANPITPYFKTHVFQILFLAA